MQVFVYIVSTQEHQKLVSIRLAAEKRAENFTMLYEDPTAESIFPEYVEPYQ